MSYKFRVHLSLVFCGLVLMTSFALALSWGWALASVVPDTRNGHEGALLSRIAPEFTPSGHHSLPDHEPGSDSHLSTESVDAAQANSLVSNPKIITDTQDVVAGIIPASFSTSQDSRAIGFHGVARMAIIIDDMGLALRNSEAIVDLQAGLTLSYLPYATDIQAQVDAAHARGHEIMLHLPMEPMKSDLSAGPHALVTGLSDDEFDRRVQENLNAFTGYVGINNHMGSRLTSTAPLMERVIQETSARDVFFVDSWTSPRSVAYQVAASAGIPRARRDVFLDHETGAAPVWQALRQAEYIARRNGSVVVIGHPRADTIAVLRAWLPMARARGIQIVPMSELVYDGTVAGDPVLIADAIRHRTARAPVGPKYEN